MAEGIHVGMVKYFPVKSPSSYDEKFSENFLRETKEVGCLSIDDNRKFYNDNRKLRYLCMPPDSEVCFDLNVGCKDIIIESHTYEKLDHLLNWIIANKQKFSENIESFGIDFICFRGLLTLILCTPYEKREDWLIRATKFRGIIYLCLSHTKNYLQKKSNATEKEKLMSAWGFKFQTYMVTDRKNGKPDVEAPLNTNDAYCVMSHSYLKNHSFVCGAEVHCIELGTRETKPYVQLKTSFKIISDKQRSNFCRFKLLKWWAQSILIDLPKIICGFRDYDGFVNKLKTFMVRDIPELGQEYWSPSVCLNFCDKFLTFVKDCVVEDDPHITYEFYFSPGENISCKKLPLEGDHQILPEWYINHWNQ